MLDRISMESTVKQYGPVPTPTVEYCLAAETQKWPAKLIFAAKLALGFLYSVLLPHGVRW